jgi:hypothetical protein
VVIAFAICRAGIDKIISELQARKALAAVSKERPQLAERAEAVFGVARSGLGAERSGTAIELTICVLIRESECPN